MPGLPFKFPPKLLGERADTDTQAMAFAKDNQDMILLGGLILVLAIGYFLFIWLFPARQVGTWRYAVCKVFLEQYATYPTELKILTAAEKQASAQIGYITTNSFGSQDSELMTCYYSTDQAPWPIITRVTIDRRTVKFDRLDQQKPDPNTVKTDTTPVTPEALMDLSRQNHQNRTVIAKINIDLFNQSIPTILADKNLDMVMPNDFPTNLEDLKYQQ